MRYTLVAIAICALAGAVAAEQNSKDLKDYKNTLITQLFFRNKREVNPKLKSEGESQNVADVTARVKRQILGIGVGPGYGGGFYPNYGGGGLGHPRGYGGFHGHGFGHGFGRSIGNGSGPVGGPFG